jgi:hypothetical protein
MTKKVTPLMKQYNTIKAKYRDGVFLFRINDPVLSSEWYVRTGVPEGGVTPVRPPGRP